MHDDDLVFGGDFFDLETELSPTSDKLQLREGELREVAVLFADIRGFSSISNLFDAETIHKKMDEIMKIFSRCITFYGGFVDKYMGDGIMALFGAKQATEQDTERAIMAAIKMQQQLRLYNAMLNRLSGFETVELGVRVGINSGMVSVGKVGEDREGDFTVYGPAVNLASRMESNAPVNKIMLPYSTMKQVIRNFDFEPVGPKNVKGFDEPIDCYTVIGPKLDSSLHRRNHNTGYIGRETELATLQQALTGLASNSSLLPVIGIRGEAGLGKTRLVYEFELANQEQARFLHGACSALSPSPLNLFSSIFETLFRLQINENLPQKRQKLDAGFSRLLEGCNADDKAELQDIKPLIAFLLEIRSDDARLKQNGTDLLNHLSKAIDVLIRMIIRQSAINNKPLVIVLDDLHWVDEASAKVLENLCNKIANDASHPPLMLVLMYRLEYILPSYFGHLSQVQEIALKPLTADDIKTLIVSHTRDLTVPEDTLAKVIHLSEGNPFFLEEWCNYIEDLPEHELKDFPVPVNLHTLILSRLDKLPPALRMLLHKASVIGQEFFVEILKHIETRLHDPIDVDATLASLEGQALILKMLGFEYSSYFFKHITTREVAYQTLLAENRKMLHGLCGEAIEELYSERLNEFEFVLAEHFSKAELKEKACLYLEKAALQAARIYNNAQATELFGKLLTMLNPEQQQKKLEIRMKLADIQFLTGKWKLAVPEVKSILAEAEAIQANAVCFDAHRFLGITAFYQRDMQAAFTQLSFGYNIAEQLKNPLLLCIATSDLGNWYFQSGRFTEAREMQSKSLEMAIDIGDLQRQAKTLSNLGLICLEEQDFATAEEHFAQSLGIAQEHRLRKEESIALGNLGYTRILQHDYSSALPLLQQKLQIAEDMNDSLELLKVLGNMGNIYIELADKQTAKACYQRIYGLRKYMGDDEGAQKVRETIASLEA
jgi:class 3 adenylate cyclase/predicted ATPase